MLIHGLYSKLPELNGFPDTYKTAKGVMIDDYLDMSYMGLGSCILGYADDDVNNAVKKCIDDGNMSTLNCYEEKELEEILLSLSPSMDCVRYARTGGEAMAMAYKMAGHKKYLYNGYHGWHLTSMQGDQNRDGFKFDTLETLKDYLQFGHKIVIIESIREEYPTKEFVDGLNALKKEFGFILIVDEITSGFRFAEGGYYKVCGYNADMIVFGKAMSNGYAMAAVVGKSEIMKKDYDKCWISSTFFTERVGCVAALYTIRKILSEKVIEKIKYIGELFCNVLTANGLVHNAVYQLPHLALKDTRGLSGFFLDNYILATGKFYPSFSHTEEHIKRYSEVLEKLVYQDTKL